MGSKTYYVYILSNHSGNLYIGMTNDILRRMHEHKNGLIEGFTKRYKLHRLIYFEETNNIYEAIEREKELKGWLRKKKLDLVKTMNPKFEDLAADWYED